MRFDLQTSFPNLSNAPITEAVLDIRADLDSTVTLEDLARFQVGIADRFTERRDRRSLETRIELQHNEPKLITPPSRPDGYIFTAPEEHLVAQARLDGFTLSRLSPYHDGDRFAKEARELWDRYVAVGRPTKVTRLAVRNINRIEIEAGAPLESYVLTTPEIARALPQVMMDFFMRLVLPDPSGAIAIVTQTFGQPASESQLPLIFDVDAFRNVDLEPTGSEVWSILSNLRDFKNRIFFNSLTARCLENYR